APAEEPAPAQAPAPAEDKPQLAQDAIVSVGDGCSLILSSGAELRNFGGIAAVHLGEGSRLRLEAGSAIRDTMTADNTRPTITAPASASVEVQEGATLFRRGVTATPNAGAGKVRYDANGGSGGPEEEVNIPQQEAYPLKTEPVPTHEPVDGTAVVFMGWSRTQDTTIYSAGTEAPALVTTVRVTANKTVKVYAVYGYDTDEDGVADLYGDLVTLRFDANGGENVPAPIVCVVGVPQDIPEQEPTRTGFTFLGWSEYPDADPDDILYKFDAEEAELRQIVLDTDTTLTAVWLANYKIVYDANGGENAPAPTVSGPLTKSTSEDGTVVYTGKATVTKEKPAREGYTFLGWDTDKDATAASVQAGQEIELTTSETTLYAIWAIGNATVVYDVNGGEGGPGSEAVNAPQESYPLNFEPEPTHEDAEGIPVVFLGWSETRDEKIYEAEDELPELVTEVQIDVGETVTVYAVYGYDLNGDGIPDVTQPIATLHFDANGGAGAPGDIVELVGMNVDIPEQEPSRDYYTFVGWSTDKDAAPSIALYKFDAFQADKKAIPLNGDTTLYAVWQANYKIVYDANGGVNAPEPTVLLSQTIVDYDDDGEIRCKGEAVITDEKPTRTGYTFQGWATNKRATRASFTAGQRVAISDGDVTLYAVWLRSSAGGGGGYSGGGTNRPKTSDTSVAIYGVILGVSALALAGVGFVLWRKRSKK
ncbi:MAG: InlB B-repeat-containing protein, partial [Oscillospiraceae bacterium]|nr:InlB B-repeat-containing protein [Oscillospiraceae bacterium]